MYTVLLSFYTRTGDPNSDPHTFTANAWLTEPPLAAIPVVVNLLHRHSSHEHVLSVWYVLVPS